MDRVRYLVPRRRTGGWRRQIEDGTNRVRLMISLAPEDAEVVDAAAGPYSPASWAAAEIVEAAKRGGK